jgi:acyl-coenzyme A thioesterase PaaI-like protein
MATYEVVITDDQDRRVCTSRLTCLIRDVAPNGADAS